jgi:alpha-tubulin suppressor-like RCC1 family protein
MEMALKKSGERSAIARLWAIALLALAALATVVSSASATSYGVMGWGNNKGGNLGFSSPALTDVPLTAVAPSDAVAISESKSLLGEWEDSLAVLEGGSVVWWGFNPGSTIPVEAGVEEAAAISAGTGHYLALLKDGKVMAWGENSAGEIGNGKKGEYVSTPVEVSGLSEVAQVSAGDGFSLALLKSGKVMAWGQNDNGQLGSGSTEDSDVPVEVSGLSEVKEVSAGYGLALARLESGAVKAWGANEAGQLGNGTTSAFSDTPVSVEGLTEAVGVSAGAGYSLALISGGHAKAWGANELGQLGDGSSTGPEKCLSGTAESPCSKKPVAVMAGSTLIKQVSAGGTFALALSQSGRVYSWGSNTEDQLGTGEGAPEECFVAFEGFEEGRRCARTPQAVSELTQAAVQEVSAGSFSALALGAPGPVVTLVSPVFGPTAGGTTVMITGAHFTGATSVTFGSTAAAKWEVVSETTIIATTPEHLAGKTHVVVTTPSGTIATNALNSASHYTFVQSSAPEFGRCKKVSPLGTGKYGEGCVSLVEGGNFEWSPEATNRGFTISTPAEKEKEPITQVAFETTGKAKIDCRGAKGSGEYSGPKAINDVTLELTGCTHSGSSCTSSGAEAGEVVFNPLEGSLGWRSAEAKTVGLDLQAKGESGPLAEFKCGTTSVTIQGSFIGEVKTDSMFEVQMLTLEQSKGKQKIEQLEGESKDVLETSLAGGSFEPTGIASTLKLTGEERLEVNTAV